MSERSENILQEADRLIHSDRNQQYGHPSDNHGTTAAFWNVYLNAKMVRRGARSGPFLFSAEDVCWFNVLQKISREVTTGIQKRDTLVDAAGYVGNIEMVRERFE